MWDELHVCFANIIDVGSPLKLHALLPEIKRGIEDGHKPGITVLPTNHMGRTFDIHTFEPTNALEDTFPAKIMVTGSKMQLLLHKREIEIGLIFRGAWQ